MLLTLIIVDLRLARWLDLRIRDPALLSANQLRGVAVISQLTKVHHLALGL